MDEIFASCPNRALPTASGGNRYKPHRAAVWKVRQMEWLDSVTTGLNLLSAAVLLLTRAIAFAAARRATRPSQDDSGDNGP